MRNICLITFSLLILGCNQSTIPKYEEGCPIKLTSAKLIDDDVRTTGKNIELHYRNISKKQIEMILFRWMIECKVHPDSSDRDVFEYTDGAIDSTAFHPEEKRNGEWFIDVRDLKYNNRQKAMPKNIIDIAVYYARFSDGTKWTTVHKSPQPEEHIKQLMR